MGETCGTCKYADISWIGIYSCKRHAPWSCNLKEKEFPDINISDWCGDYEKGKFNLHDEAKQVKDQQEKQICYRCIDDHNGRSLYSVNTTPFHIGRDTIVRTAYFCSDKCKKEWFDSNETEEVKS